MITNDCLVGCTENSHHKYCNNQPTIELKYYLSDVENELSYDFKPFQPLSKKEIIENRLKIIVENFGLDLNLKTQKKMIEKFYFIGVLYNRLHWNYDQIKDILKMNSGDNVRYALARLTEVKNDHNYQYKTNKLRKEVALFFNTMKVNENDKN